MRFNLWAAIGLSILLSSGQFVLAALPAPFVNHGTKLGQTQIAAMGAIGDFCTGTLIGPRVIITAAHCVVGPDYNVPVGTFHASNGQSYQVTMTPDPLYDFKNDGPMNMPNDMAGQHDIALGILNADATGIDPVTIANAEPKIGDTMLFAGRGLPTHERMSGPVKVITLSPIGLTVRGFGDAPTGGNEGDSGGPDFLVDSAGLLSLFSVHSTSTIDKDDRAETGWVEAMPYTMGDARALPTDGTTFLKDFATKDQLKICGVNLPCKPVTKP